MPNRKQDYILDEWITYTLGELGEFKNGINKDKESFGYGSLFVNISDVFNGNIIKANTLSRLDANFKEIEEYKLNYGDIILVRSSVKLEGVGYPILFETAKEPVLFCGFTIRYRPNQHRINPLYLLYVLRSSETRKKVLSKATVSANTNINQESFSTIDILAPTMPEQKKITSILITVDTIIDKTKQLIEKYKKIKQGLVNDIFVRGVQPDGQLRSSFKESPELYKNTEYGPIPKEWTSCTFRDICSVRQGLQIPISSRYKNAGANRYIYITIQYLNNIGNSSYLEYIESPNPSVVCKKDDILMTRTGNTGQVVSGVEGVFHNNFFLVDYNRELVSKDYIVYYLNRDEVQNYIESRAGVTTIPDLKHKDFYDLFIPIPSKQEQDLITSKLSRIDNLIVAEQIYLKKLDETKQGLMQDLLTGKVRVKVEGD